MSEQQSPARRGPTNLTPEHKAALAKGRVEGRAVKAYLEALAANKPKRGRKRTAESIAAQLRKIEDALEDSGPLKQLQLIQQQMDLQKELETLDDGSFDISELEADFIAVAKAYSQRKGISYAAWRKIGVATPVLTAAGISRSQ